MPAMSHRHARLCRSAPWRSVARRVVLPWALQGFEPEGDVLEIGAGSGAMAEQVMASFPAVRVTATDFDQHMVDAIGARLAPFGGRATVRQADATALPFSDGSFDAVFSFVMLHHTIEWEKALAEATRVVRPGGCIVGYDLLSAAPLRFIHRNHADLRLMGRRELREQISTLPIGESRIRPTFGGFLVRFVLRKAS